MESILFVCTHNSRRSHFAQIHAQIYATLHSLPFTCYSAGTEATAFHPSAVEAIKMHGYAVHALNENDLNPTYEISFSDSHPPLQCFSKDLSHPSLPKDFIAVMVCDHADQNCPYIPGAKQRISLPFQDPKFSDGTEVASQVYFQSSQEIKSAVESLLTSLNSK